MRLLKVVFAALPLVASARTSSFASGEPLAGAYQTLSKEVAAGAALIQKTAAPMPAPQAADVADYCVVDHSWDRAGMVDFLTFSCTNAVQIPTLSRWCVTSSCMESLVAEMKDMMSAKGYAPLTTFDFQRSPAILFTRWVFQKAAAAPGAERYCLARRHRDGKNSPNASYKVDCADGAMVEMTVEEPNNGTSAITKFMASRNYEQVGSFEENSARFSHVLFRQRTHP